VKVLCRVFVCVRVCVCACVSVCAHLRRPQLAPTYKFSSPTFLVGLRMSGQAIARTSVSAYDKVQVLDSLDEINVNADRRIEDATSATMETASTGKVFKAICEHLEPGVNEDEEMQRHPCARLVELGSRESWLIDAKDLRVRAREFLGSGGFGVVVGGSLHGTGVAVKILKKSDGQVHARHLLAVSNEMRILRHIRHPAIVLIFGACIDVANQNISLVLEHIIGTPLDRYIDAHSLATRS
jgi:hypothetical protein